MAADLTLTGISKRFGTNEVLTDLHLHIRSGEFVTLLGPSGCGKTTLLRMIAGLDTPNAGSLHIGGVNMKGLPPQKRPISMVFQSYALFPHMNVRNNIIFGLKILKTPEHEIFAKLKKHLQGKTVIIISNRLKLLTMTDRVLILEDGSIASSGRHEQLLLENEFYRTMYDKQMRKEHHEGGNR